MQNKDEVNLQQILLKTLHLVTLKKKETLYWLIVFALKCLHCFAPPALNFLYAFEIMTAENKCLNHLKTLGILQTILF